MVNYVYTAMNRYFSTLEKIGVLPFQEAEKLLVLNLYYDFLFKDYRGSITTHDYTLIEKALNCLFGTSCLLPYPNYMKNGRLHIGEIQEVLQRIKNIEDTPVLKLMPDEENDSDIIILSDEDEA